MVDAPLSADTTADAESVQIARWRAMSPAEKLALVDALTVMVLRLQREGLRLRQPKLDDSAAFRILVGLRLGEELATRAYGQPRDG